MNHPFFRFLLVGLINTAIGLSAMYILLHIAGLSYWPSTFTGNAIGACVSYLLNRTFTFQSNASVAKSAFRFIIVILSCYFISYYIGKHAAYWAITKIPSVPDLYKEDAAVLFGTALYTITNYLGQKHFVFPK